MTSPDSPSLSTEIDMDKMLKRLAHLGGPFDRGEDVEIINWLANRELSRRAPALSEGEPTPTIAELRGEVIAARHALLGRRIEGHLMPEGGCSICTVLLKDSVPRKFYDDLFADWQRIRIAANGEFGHQQAEIQEWQNRLRDTLAELDASRAPSLSTSSPELKTLLDEFRGACCNLFSEDTIGRTVREYGKAEDQVVAARSAIELSFATLTEEIKRLREENTEARQILVEAVDRDISVKDTLRALASVASNGIFWRDKSIASLREELSEWLDRWNAREREVSVIRRSALTEYEARTLLIYLDAKHAGKPLPQGDDLVEFGKSADAKLRLISETPK